MNMQYQRDIELRLLLKQDHHQFVQQYRRAMHLHGDPSQSENVSDDDMLQSISLAESALAPGEFH